MAGVDLTQVDGLDILSETLLSEIGTDMSKWKRQTLHLLVGLISATGEDWQQVIHTKTKKTNNRANLPCRQAAASLVHAKLPW